MALRWPLWSDHLPLWVVLGATAASGLYEPIDLALMALPLAAAAAVEALAKDLSHYRRGLEVAALLFFLGDLFRAPGLVTVAVHTLFLLAGVRLVLPRSGSEQRQTLLIGFTLYLATALGPPEPAFLAWTLAYVGATTLVLLRLGWEASAACRPGVPAPPPYTRVPLWVGSAVLLGAGFFVVLPRLGVGLQASLFRGAGRAATQAGLAASLNLGGDGPIEPNAEVAVRIAPPDGAGPDRDPTWAMGLERLRAVALERVEGLRWESSELTPPMVPAPGSALRQAEFLFTPSFHGILALPPRWVRLDPPDLALRPGLGASLRWRFSRTRGGPITVSWRPSPEGLPEPRLTPRRLQLLTHLDPTHAAAQRASLRFAPAILPTPALVRALEGGLAGFAYTLENPSARAPNPLEDFLERSRAGHCEYFASAMALMLRARGVPARVVNGYRLGPWLPEGGYYRVSQNEAHAWVEYWHEGRWWTSDPTPGLAPGLPGSGPGLGFLVRWGDALRYRWDRHVVRFSDQDQVAGLAWLQDRLQGWDGRRLLPSRGLLVLLGLAGAAGLLWWSRDRWQRPPEGVGRIRALAPLLRRTRTSGPPQPGDTARTWLLRLAALRPERQAALLTLAEAVEAEAYGPGSNEAARLAQAEAQAWRGWSPPSKPTSP